MPRCLGFRILKDRLGEMSDAVETNVEMREFWTVEMHFWPPAIELIHQSDHIASVSEATMMTSSCKAPNCQIQVRVRQGHVTDWTTCASLRGELSTCFFQPAAVLCEQYWDLMRWQSCAADTLTISYSVARQTFRQKKHLIWQPDGSDTVRLSWGADKHHDITVFQCH